MSGAAAVRELEEMRKDQVMWIRFIKRRQGDANRILKFHIDNMKYDYDHGISREM